MRLDDLQEMIAQEQWEDISGKLNDILDPLSRQDIDEFVSSINGSCKYWAQMLVNTGLFRDDGKAGYLTRRIFMRIWDGSTYHNKWILLKTFLELYDIPFDHGENSSLAGFLLTMQIRTGIHPRDVLDLFIYQQKNNGKITASMPFSVQ